MIQITSLCTPLESFEIKGMDFRAFVKFEKKLKEFFD